MPSLENQHNSVISGDDRRATDPDLVPMPKQDMAAGRELTAVQKMAERTNGLVTPANAVTAAGLALTAAGCGEFAKGGNMAAAVGMIAAGAVCDALDGATARATRTANYQAGRHFDAVTDGIKSVMFGAALFASGAYSADLLAMNYGPKLAGWAVNGVRFARGHGDKVKTIKVAKAAEIARWIGPGCAAIGQVAKSIPGAPGEIVTLADRGALVATVGACALGLVAMAGYIKDIKK